MRSSEISPAPTAEEAAAISVAIEALWPRPVVVDHRPRATSAAWRFSGRWWQRDRLAPADRPWS